MLTKAKPIPLVREDVNIGTMTARVQLQKKIYISGREPQGAWVKTNWLVVTARRKVTLDSDSEVTLQNIFG
jgi:hypothetical protein